MPALELDKARKVYGADEAQVVALDDVTLTVAEDEMMLLVGPSGSGKTTLLTVAARCFVQPPAACGLAAPRSPT